MPTPRPLNSYPKEYRRLFKRAAREEVRVETQDREAADSLRSLLYTFRTQMRKEEEWNPVLLLMAEGVELRVEGNWLVAGPKVRDTRIEEALQT